MKPTYTAPPTRFGSQFAHHRSGLLIPTPERVKQLEGLRKPTPSELRTLIRFNPWYDPALRERLRGNEPKWAIDLSPDAPGVILPPRNEEGYQRTVTAAAAAGPAKASWTTAVTGINPQNIVNILGNDRFKDDGRILRITAMGGMGTLVTTPGTTTFEVRMGTTSNIVAFTTGAIQLNATAHTLLPFTLQILLTLRTIGSGTGAQFMGMATIQGVMFTVTIAATDLWGRVSAADAAVSHVQMQVPVTAPALGTGWDSTVTNLLDLFVARSVSNAANTMTIHEYLVESLN